MAKLVLQSGPDIGAVVTVGAKVTAGRLQSCELTLNEGQSSRQHFEVERIGESFQLKDLGSRNGTVHNELELKQPVLLSNGDIIQVGATRVAFFLDAPALDKGQVLGGATIRSAPMPSAYGYRYEAEQRSLNRQVLVEALAADYRAGSEVRDRFLASLRRAAGFDHPHILAVYEVNEERGIPFALRPPFEGQTLRRLVRSGTVTLEQASGVLVQVADALSEIHGKGQTHGRISPSTVLVDGSWQVKLVGFGPDPRGRVTDPALPEAPWHAAFCSPESGRGLDQTASADIYSLGALAYWLITGHLPVTGDTAIAVLRQHASPEPILPAQTLMADLPPRLAQAIDRLLKKSPAERPQDAAAARKLLEGARDASRQSSARISARHTESFQAIDPGAVEDEEESAPRAAHQSTVTRRKRQRSAASSERRRAGSTARRRPRKNPSGISDRLVSPAGLERGETKDTPLAWGLSLAMVALLYLTAYLATRVVMSFLDSGM